MQPNDATIASTEARHSMVIVDCPWCGEGAGVEMMPERAVLRCDGCDVTVDVAEDERPAVAAAA